MSAKRRAALAEAGNSNPYSTLTYGTWPDKSTGIARRPPSPTARPVYTGPDATTVALVIERDQGRCVRCGVEQTGERGWDWSVQHRRARGNGGTRRPDTNTAPNLILLCGSATTGCHGWVESEREAARPFGWAILSTDNPALKPIDHAVHGRVWLTGDGGWTTTEPAVGA
ncbi:hypothetical protein BDK92_7325 [Micromonospora pisi]|uniref:HNH endonuclease n=2 Tax=Micromonospora pisi TaxID=589240 RepID=A0A495JV19_9ACTN|nr:hypothetical protein BDK92_7325 [Micromonospora pisi]